MIQAYIDRKAEMKRELQSMKKDIEEHYTEHDLVGKRVHVRGVDERDGEKVDFFAYYMGVVLEEEEIGGKTYLGIIFNKQFYYDNSVMLDERNYKLTVWSPTIEMEAAPVLKKVKPYKKGKK